MMHVATIIKILFFSVSEYTMFPFNLYTARKNFSIFWMGTCFTNCTFLPFWFIYKISFP